MGAAEGTAALATFTGSSNTGVISSSRTVAVILLSKILASVTGTTTGVSSATTVLEIGAD